VPHAPRCCRWAPHLAAALSAPPVAAAAIFAIAAGAGPAPAAAQPAACEALAGQAIPVAAIGLPTGGASLREAHRVPATLLHGYAKPLKTRKTRNPLVAASA
jgi:hypothetical protein